MVNPHENLKQEIMRQGAIQEVQQTVATFKSLEESLDQLLAIELTQLATQNLHLTELAAEIDDAEFSTELHILVNNNIKTRRQWLQTMILLCRNSIISSSAVLNRLADRQSHLKNNQ
ncbi:hypothetical protein KII91_00590 [Leuconostoc gelidum subsp. gelidum]|uniref:hypothetical protein n=1 Tax=Leuconostoc gelidum TaxID=1244 RepID=UPI001CC72988|nr:hypothetical protein [Leuconostoc gelidum]MBZ5977839.1 hypothetical protein [Leuconostoc gelidum subsp. gelidum]MBZ6001840.1 hypothetical protein [Leuconostoc gelidum subsp. gelidum]